jgi:starvation-inducible DNA-binding protein
MNELQTALKKVLANTFVMYFKTHTYHWNVEGMFFPQLHEFFGNLYEELYGAVDPIAEHIRAMDSYAPLSLVELKSLSTVMETLAGVPDAKSMVNNLIVDNNTVIISLMQAYQEADKASELGLANFLQDRIDIHQKHGWMLKATAK